MIVDRIEETVIDFVCIAAMFIARKSAVKVIKAIVSIITKNKGRSKFRELNTQSLDTNKKMHEPAIPREIINKAELIMSFISSVFLSVIHLTKYLCIPPCMPITEIKEKIVINEIIVDEIPITSGEVILDKITQKRKPENIVLMASKYKLKTPFPTVFLLIPSFILETLC
jgi:hypothetical protein